MPEFTVYSPAGITHYDDGIKTFYGVDGDFQTEACSANDGQTSLSTTDTTATGSLTTYGSHSRNVVPATNSTVFTDLNLIGSKSEAEYNGTGAGLITQLYGHFAEAELIGDSTNVSNLDGERADANATGSATISNLRGVVGTANVIPAATKTVVVSRADGVLADVNLSDAAGTITGVTSARGLVSSVDCGDCTVTECAGVDVHAPQNLAATTTAYGIRVNNVAGAIGNNYAIYTGTGVVRLGGPIVFAGAYLRTPVIYEQIGFTNLGSVGAGGHVILVAEFLTGYLTVNATANHNLTLPAVVDINTALAALTYPVVPAAGFRFKIVIRETGAAFTSTFAAGAGWAIEGVTPSVIGISRVLFCTWLTPTTALATVCG